MSSKVTAARSPLDRPVRVSSLPPAQAPSDHVACTWVGALPGAGVTAPHADCHQPDTCS